MRYVLHSMQMQLRNAMQYRASFIMQCIAQCIMTGGELLAVLVLMGRFTSLGQWTAPEILFFFGVMQLTFALNECFGRGISNFAFYVGKGEFDTMLLRPRSLLAQVALSRADPRRLGGMLVGVAAIWAASRQIGLQWSMTKAALLLAAMAGSFMLFTGLFLIEAVVSFFSVKSIEMVNVLTYGGRQACEYPVDIYPRAIRLLFTYVAPIALCMHLPVSFILEKPLLPLPLWQVYAAPLAGVVFFMIIAWIWYRGVRHYRSTGT